MSRFQELRSTVPFKSNWKAACLTCCSISCPVCTRVFVSKNKEPTHIPWLDLHQGCPVWALGRSGWAALAVAPSETPVGWQLPWLIVSWHLILCIHDTYPSGLIEICEGSLIHLSELGSLVWGVSLVPRTEQADTMLRQRNSPHKLAESRDSSFQQQRGNQEKRCWSPKSFQFLAK